MVDREVYHGEEAEGVAEVEEIGEIEEINGAVRSGRRRSGAGAGSKTSERRQRGGKEGVVHLSKREYATLCTTAEDRELSPAELAHEMLQGVLRYLE